MRGTVIASFTHALPLPDDNPYFQQQLYDMGFDMLSVGYDEGHGILMMRVTHHDGSQWELRSDQKHQQWVRVK